MNVATRPYLRTAHLRFFEHDPGMIRLRRAGRILLGGLLSLIPALGISLLIGVARPPADGSAPLPDLTLLFPTLIVAVLLAANIAGSTVRERKLGMLRHLLAGFLVSIPASLVAEGTFHYCLGFAAAAALALYLRRFGPSWKGITPVALFVFVLVPRMEITPALLPRLWVSLAAAFLASYWVSFRVLPIRLNRALLDCLARFIAAAASTVALVRSRAGLRSRAAEIRKTRREMNESLDLWQEIATRVLSPKDPAWAALDGLADGQFRLGNLLRIASGSLEEMAAAAPALRGRAGEVLAELETVLESARRTLVLEGKFELDLARFRERVKRLREEWESDPSPITALDIQVGRFAAAMDRISAVLESIAGRVRRLSGREE